MLDHEAAEPGLEVMANAVRTARQKNDRTHDNRRKLAERRTASRKQIDLSNMPVYLASTLGGDTTAQCRNILASPSLLRDAGDRHEAVLFVVENVAKPGYHTALITRLRGGMVVDTTYYRSNSSKGVSILYAPLLHQRKSVHFTERFAAQYPGIIDTFEKCTRGSKWKLASLVQLADYHEKDGRRPVKLSAPDGFSMHMLGL